MKAIVKLRCLFFITLAGWPALGADLEICNRTQETVSIAMGSSYWCDSTGGAFNDPIMCERSKGWLITTPNECVTTPKWQGQSMYARGSGGSVWTDDQGVRLCIRDRAFDFTSKQGKGPAANSPDCENEGGRRVRFRLVKGHSLELTGGNAPKTVLRVVNRTQHPVIDFAVAHKEGNDWNAEGWFQVRAGGYRDIHLGKYQGNVYILGVTADLKTVWNMNGQGERFCIETSSGKGFDITQANLVPCDGPNQQRAIFAPQRIAPTFKPTEYYFNP